MDKEREIIHRILDGDAGEEEKKDAARSIGADPGLREEFEGLARAVRMLEASERKEPPLSFTADVMRRLVPEEPKASARLREFLFGSRVLRWNMASVMAAAVVVIVSLVAGLTMFRSAPIQTAGLLTHEATVRLTFYAPEARSVAVAGDFNKWRTDADEMKGTDGMWSIELKLKPGVYSYSFVVDGTSWVVDPGAETYRDDGFGSRNAVLRVAI